MRDDRAPVEPIDGPPAGRADDAPTPSPRRSYRVLVRERSGSQGARVVDVQLQVRRKGALVWAQTFSDPMLARELEDRLDRDLDELDDATFRRTHRVTSDR
jgi:hypothetical protein